MFFRFDIIEENVKENIFGLNKIKYLNFYIIKKFKIGGKLV